MEDRYMDVLDLLWGLNIDELEQLKLHIDCIIEDKKEEEEEDYE